MHLDRVVDTSDVKLWLSVMLGDDGISDLGIAALRSWPILFHATHSVNVRLSHDRRRAKRVDGIKGVCFSSRPVCIGERIYVRIVDASSVRNGALRFGFTTDDPCTIDESDLPRLWSILFLLYSHISLHFIFTSTAAKFFLQCFDTVGWVAARAYDP